MTAGEPVRMGPRAAPDVLQTLIAVIRAEGSSRMLNVFRFSLLALALLASPARAADPTEDRQRAALAGHYYLEGAMEVGSELVLKPDGRFEWSLSYGAADQYASGSWSVGADSILLTTQAPKSGKPLFSLDEVAPWNPNAQKRLEEFAAERRDRLIEEACGFVKTYRVGMEHGELNAIAAQAADDPNDPAPRRAAEASLAPALAALERSRLDVETAAAAAAAIKAKAEQGQSRGSAERSSSAHQTAVEAAVAAAEAAANEAGATQSSDSEHQAATVAVDELEAADNAVQDYLQRLEDVWRLHARAGKPSPELRHPAFDAGPCLPPSAASTPGGYAVVVGDPQRGIRAEGIGVEFVYSDGRTERTETSPAGWALAVQRPGARLKQAILQPADRPTETIVLDESKGRVFAIRLDTAAATPAPFEQLILTQDGSDLISPQVRGRYVRH